MNVFIFIFLLISFSHQKEKKISEGTCCHYCGCTWDLSKSSLVQCAACLLAVLCLGLQPASLSSVTAVLPNESLQTQWPRQRIYSLTCLVWF